MDKTEKKIVELIEKDRDRLIAFADDIYNHAELGYKEFRTSRKIREFFESCSLKTRNELAITGVKGYLNQGKKDVFSLALLGEMDALRIPNHAHANPETGAAHCCGHHAQLAGLVGAALALSDPEVAKQLDGQVIFFAVPAEEYGEVEFKNSLKAEGKIAYGGGKCELIRIGKFDEIDACLAHHTSPLGIELGSGSNNGFVSKVIELKGRAAHAAGAPENGINALSAATLGLSALALNRETFRDQDSVRVHPILTKGGDLVNVVPNRTVLETLVRAKTLDAIRDAAAKTDRSFMAGALALGAGYEISTMPGYLPALPQAFPEELAEVVRELTDHPVSIVDPGFHSGGSTDVGDVQHLMPVYTFRTGGITGSHHQSDFDVIDREETYILTAKIFAVSAYRLLKEKAALARREREAYRPVFSSREEYVSFMNQFDSVKKGDYSNESA